MGGKGAGVLEALRDSEEREKAKGWDVDIHIYQLFPGFMGYPRIRTHGLDNARVQNI